VRGGCLLWCLGTLLGWGLCHFVVWWRNLLLREGARILF
jgi:hypothetical protein